MTDAQYHSFIVSQLRRASMRWPPKNQCLTDARVARGVYLCASCKQHVPASVVNEKGKRVKGVSVDHIRPVIPVETGFQTWDDFINNLFCEVDNLQLLCINCHVNEKSRLERLSGREFGTNIASVKKVSPETYQSWSNMNSRCESENSPSYKYYGAKGIKVCDRWRRIDGKPNGILNFIEDMGYRPEETSLDRIDYLGDYTPENCRWASAKEQARNTSANNWITHNGEEKVLEDWAEQLDIKANTILTRLRRGWSVPEALELKERIKQPYSGRLTPDDFEFIQTKLSEGWSQVKIGKELEIDSSVVSRLVKKFNLTAEERVISTQRAKEERESNKNGPTND